MSARDTALSNQMGRVLDMESRKRAASQERLHENLMRAKDSPAELDTEDMADDDDDMVYLSQLQAKDLMEEKARPGQAGLARQDPAALTATATKVDSRQEAEKKRIQGMMSSPSTADFTHERNTKNTHALKKAAANQEARTKTAQKAFMVEQHRAQTLRVAKLAAKRKDDEILKRAAGERQTKAVLFHTDVDKANPYSHGRDAEAAAVVTAAVVTAASKPEEMASTSSVTKKSATATVGDAAVHDTFYKEEAEAARQAQARRVQSARLAARHTAFLKAAAKARARNLAQRKQAFALHAMQAREAQPPPKAVEVAPVIKVASKAVTKALTAIAVNAIATAAVKVSPKRAALLAEAKRVEQKTRSDAAAIQQDQEQAIREAPPAIITAQSEALMEAKMAALKEQLKAERKDHAFDNALAYKNLQEEREARSELESEISATP